MDATMYPEIALWEAALLLLGGLWAAVWSAGRFVDGAAAVAQRHRVAPFVVGLVIVGFGTSLPELTISALSSGTGHAALSLGNAYGSNIYNIAVILGVVALIRPIRIRPSIRRFAAPILVVSGVLPWMALVYFEAIPRWLAALLLVLFAYLLCLLMTDESLPQARTDDAPEVRHPWGWVLVGLSLLLVSSHLVVWGAVGAARQLGVPELAIGLTVVAAGTSMPELVTSLVALRRRQKDLLLGNVIGSNLFNGLVVVGVSALVRPIEHVPGLVLLRDMPLMIVLSLMLCTRRITRCRALVWLLGFAAYVAVLL